MGGVDSVDFRLCKRLMRSLKKLMDILTMTCPPPPYVCAESVPLAEHLDNASLSACRSCPDSDSGHQREDGALRWTKAGTGLVSAAAEFPRMDWGPQVGNSRNIVGL